MNWKRSYLLPSLLFIGFISANEAQAQVSGDPDPVIPNVFTPNGDGVNDTYHIEGLDGSWQLMIFDRWGSLIFATQQGQGAAWNGANIQGEQCATAVYFYTLKNQNTGQSFNGTIQLLR
jgi:gliding motility-associated-like protein